MYYSNTSRSVALALVLLSTLVLCLHHQVHAAKIMTKMINTTAISTNSSDVVATNITKEPTMATKVPLNPTVKPVATIAEAKTDNEDDPVDNIDVNVENEDVAETEFAEDTAEEGVEETVNSAAIEESEADREESQSAESETALAAVEKDDDTSTFSVWNIARNVWNWIRDDLSESLFGDDDGYAAAGATKSLMRHVRSLSDTANAVVESRTFGKIRRLQMAIIPLIFKFGVLTAMVAFLIMLGMKTLFLVKLLVLMNAAAILAKFVTLKSGFGGQEHYAPTWNYQAPPSSGWAVSAPPAVYSHSHEQHSPTKEIHLHIHGGQLQQGYGASTGHGAVVSGGHGWESRSDPYGAYAPMQDNEVNNELNNMGPVAILPTRYPSNHRH